MWVKQKDETYIKQETTQVVNLSILKREIEELENQIKELEKELLPYPKGADERLKEAVDMYNEQNVNSILILKQAELSEKLQLLNEITNG